VGTDPVRLVSGAFGLSESELRLQRALMDMWVGLDELREDAENERLHDACLTKLARVARMTGELKLAPEIRKEARRHVMDATRWLASMPAQGSRLRGAAE